MCFLITFGICSHKKKQSNEFLLIHTHKDLLHLLHIVHPLFSVNYFLKKHHSVLVCFDSIFVFQN